MAKPKMHVMNINAEKASKVAVKMTAETQRPVKPQDAVRKLVDDYLKAK